MPRKDIPQPASGSYRVYSNAKEFVVVNASSALEALQASGVQSAYKIERESIDYVHVLSPSAWSNSASAQVPVPNSVAAEAKETVFIPEATAQVSKDAEAPLSNDDVNKLLNS